MDYLGLGPDDAYDDYDVAPSRSLVRDSSPGAKDVELAELARRRGTTTRATVRAVPARPVSRAASTSSRLGDRAGGGRLVGEPHPITSREALRTRREPP